MPCSDVRRPVILKPSGAIKGFPSRFHSRPTLPLAKSLATAPLDGCKAVLLWMLRKTSYHWMSILNPALWNQDLTTYEFIRDIESHQSDPSSCIVGPECLIGDNKKAPSVRCIFPVAKASRSFEPQSKYFMVTSSNGYIFHVTGPLWGESTGHRWIPLAKTSDAELWCFLWSAPKETVEQTIEMPAILDAIALIMTSL